MLRKLRITESERKEILSLFNKILNEEAELASLKGVVKFKGKPVPNSQIKLFKDDKIFKGAISDENGNYLIEGIPLGTYKIVLTNKVEGYDDAEEEITFDKNKTYTSYISFRDTQDTKEVVVKTDIKRFTIIDVQVLDNDSEPVPSCVIEIFDKDGKSVQISPNKTDNDGTLELISISSDTPNFESQGKPGETKTKITIRATYGNVSETKEYEIVLNNGLLKKYDDAEGIERISKFKDTNKLSINLNLNLNYTLNVVDSETDELLESAVINLYGDEEKTDLIKRGLGEITGTLKREQKTKKEGFENTTDLYYVVSNDGYVTKQGKVTLSRRKTNNFKIALSKVPPPTPPSPPKDLTERACRKLTRDHYNNMSSLDAGNIKLSEIGGVNKVKEVAIDVKNCYLKYKSSYPDRFKKIINRLINVKNDLSYFQLTFTKDEIRDIYSENKTMSLSNTIRKVISESIERKNQLTEEKKLVKNRLLFSLNGVRKNNIFEAKTKLKNERVKLLRFGYNQDLVNESFLDIMKGLYGNDGTDVLTDIKSRLGQKIADQVKNKQEEHEMILSAFNELPVEMIERAIKENRVDELSGEISTKALENYRTQFGTEGLSGIMIASVDENKFKQEVAKLLDPAIKDITTKMDEKLKQVQDVVSGGINPTA